KKAEWTYVYHHRLGERPTGKQPGGSEPKAMTVSGPDIYVTGLTDTEKEDADILTLKLSPEGKERWVARYSSPEHDCDRAYSISTDTHGGVYVAGESFIPARPGVPEGWRLVVIRYDANSGRQLWAQRSPVITKNRDMAIQVVARLEGGCYVGGTALLNGIP